MKNKIFKKIISNILIPIMIFSAVGISGFADGNETLGYIKLVEGNRADLASNVSGRVEVCSDTAYPGSDHSIRFKLGASLSVIMPDGMDWNEYDTFCMRYRTEKPKQLVNLLFCGPKNLTSGNTYWRRMIDTSDTWTEYTLSISAFASIFSKSENGKSLGSFHIQASGWGNTSYDADSYFYLDSIYLKTSDYGKELNIPVSSVDNITELEPDKNGDFGVDFTFDSELYSKDYTAAVEVSKSGSALPQSAYSVALDGKKLSVKVFGPVTETYRCKITLLADKIYTKRGKTLKTDVSREFDVKFVDILAGLNNQSWSSMAKYIAENRDFLLASSGYYDKFDSLSDKDKNILCMSLMSGIPYASAADFEKAFDNAVKAYVPYTNNPTVKSEEHKITSRISIDNTVTPISEDEKKKLYLASSSANLLVTESGKGSFEFLKAVGVLDENLSYSANQTLTYSQFLSMANGLKKGSLTFSQNESDGILSVGGGIAIVTDTLGYEYAALIYGGYPNGYIRTAKDAGLLTGINITDINSPLTLSVACDILKCAADADIMTLTSAGDKNEYISRDGITPLTEWKKIENTEGIISANGYTDLLSEESDLDKNYVTIGGKNYFAGTSDAESFIGCDVKIYYDNAKKSSYPKILYIENTDDTKVFECNLDDIVVNGNEITYDFESKNEKIKVSPYATYLVNGKMASGAADLLYKYGKGSVKFISSDSSSVYTVVSITAYTAYIASGISKISSLVYTDDGTDIELDPDEDSYGFKIIKNGSAALLDSIKSDNLLLVAESSGKGRNYKKILVSDDNFAAKVSETGDDYIVADGIKYKTDKSVLQKIFAGKIYQFYVDSFGCIAAIKTEQSAVYGYLYGLKSENLGEISCRIFSENKRWVTLRFAKRLKIDGGKSMSEEDAYSLLMSSANGYRGIIKYKVNLKGEVTQIERPIDMTDVSLISDDAINAAKNDTFRKSYAGSEILRSQYNGFGGMLFLDKECAVFIIPDNARESDIDVMRVSALPADEEYNIIAYDVDENLVTKIVSINQKPKAIGGSTNFIIVKSVGSALNSEGEDCPSINGYWHGQEISMTVKTSSYLTENEVYSLKKGDPIRIAMNENFDVTQISKYIPDSNGFYSTPRHSSSFIAGGRVIRNDRKNGKIIVKYNLSGGYYAISYTNESVAYLYDFKDDDYRKVDFPEVMPGDTVVARMSYFTANEMVVLRK